MASHTGSLNPHALKNLDQFPTVEITFEKPHRIRSWSLQSVGSNVSNSVFGALATVLVLQRCTLDGTWHILDIVRSQEILDYQTGSSVSEFFSLAKYRIDRTIPSPELFCKIRISAAAVKSQTLQAYAEKVGLPVLERTFLMNRFDRHIIRYQAESKTWYDDGLRLEPGTVAATVNQFGNMTTDELLNQAGQSRLKSAAYRRSRQ